MIDLQIEHFDDYFFAVHGTVSFPWQRRLLSTVFASGWPQSLALPTASGKTAILDVAVFTLAVQAARGATITTPRRIALVVDRRIVVDDAFHRAEKIRKALITSTTGVLKGVASALCSLGGEEPLVVALLRGGIYREDYWARSPAQPVVLCSTVDQVGSRLLHRGYGLSSSMWPLHAGLLGNDTLIVLDEAHCSRPFGETLAWIARFREVGVKPLAAPFTVVEMTATPHTDAEPFRLDEDDHAEPVLLSRLAASKHACLIPAKPKEIGLCATLADQAQEGAGPGDTVLVVANRVATARAVANELHDRSKRKKDPLAAEVILLTGRTRPVERDLLIAKWRDRIMAGRDRAWAATKKPLIIVATQCVEVGADLDVDALVTECCPLDALRQRLGRLDRLGELGESFVSIVCRFDQAWDGNGEPPDDPVYGTTLALTWHWLVQKCGKAETIELGTIALDALMPSLQPQVLAGLYAPAPQAPVMFPAYCDLWVQTGPEPAASPDPAIFLHGPQLGEPEVRFVWRADLGSDPQTWADTIAFSPPVSGETLAVRLSEARRWLACLGEDPEAADLEGQPLGAAAEGTAKKGHNPPPFRPSLRWRGPERSEVARAPVDLRPGDTLVVPADYGGCDEWGWNPTQTADTVLFATDLADQARIAARRTAVLRLHPKLLTQWHEAAPLLETLACHTGDELPDEVGQEVRALLNALMDNAACPLELLPLVAALATDRRPRVEPHPSGIGLVIQGRRRMADSAADFTDEDETSSTASREVTLSDHLNDVGRMARAFAAAAGLPSEIQNDLALAGRLHDLGKADPRFQAWLQNGDRLASLRTGLLAKSARTPANRSAMRAARVRSGYPEGGRHELLSVRLAESAPALLATAHDQDLVLHLIESHHGHCRGFAPVVTDKRPVPVACAFDGIPLATTSDTGLGRLGSGVAERFWRLVRRYGWWGLSYLEACLRLADHRASETTDNGGEI